MPRFPTGPQPVVLLSGRFQPFHPGHYQSYRWLCDRFGPDAVWLGTSDRAARVKDSAARPAPLNFDEKRAIITGLFDIAPERVVCVASPYRPVELLSRFDPESAAYVAAMGEKDGARLAGRPYFRSLPDSGPLEPYRVRGYVQLVPTGDFPLSASEIRARFQAGDEAALAADLQSWYGDGDPALFALMRARFGCGVGV